MFLSCKCLNIILKYSGRQLPTPELSLPNHEFFRDNPLIISSPDDNFAVLKQQLALIDEQVIDTWNITRCINCYQFTYALSDNLDNSEDNLEDKEPLEPARYLVINKSLINVDNLPNQPDNSKLQNSLVGNVKRSTVGNSKMSDNLRLVSDNLNSMSDNTALISTKTTLMTDNTTSDKTMMFSDNVPLITDNSAITVDNSAITADNSLTNSTISIDNSTTNLNDNSLLSDNSAVASDNLNLTSDNLTLVSDNLITADNSTMIGDNSNMIGDNSTMIGDNSTMVGDNSKISAITSDNSTISADNSAIDDPSVNKNDFFIKMRHHPDYSDIYNVIIDSDNDSDIDDNEILTMRKQLLPGVQASLGNLHQQYEVKVKDVKDIVEDNIKKFTAKQYEYLENYKERGHHDYYVLTNKILRNELKKIRNGNIEVIADIHCSVDGDDNKGKSGSLRPKMSDIVRPITRDNLIVPGSLIFSETNKMAEVMIDGRREKEGEEKRVKRKQVEKQNSDNYEEVIFAIEGMDDEEMEVEDNKATDNEEEDDDGESDDSGQDEGIHIPRVQRGGHPTLAKSLPVTVPNFGFGRRAQRHNDGQQSVDPLDPHNIRASIKALAKSVHGDTVFGDLPRPRFSTEI